MIITIAAQKGGVSKTTTAAAICQALSFKGKGALLIDSDAQGSASLIYGAADNGTGGTYSLINGSMQAEELIQETKAGRIIPASPLLDRLDIELNNKPGRDSFLKAAIEPIKKDYDCIVIDTPPGLGTCLVQALTACDLVIIPLLCDPQALQGLHQVTETIEQVKKYCNPSLKIAAVVITQYQARATLTRQYEALIVKQCEELGLHLAEARIRRAIALQEAQACRESLFVYNPNCNPAKDYIALCEEIGLLQTEEIAGLNISLPLKSVNIERLEKILEANGSMIKKALGADNIEFLTDEKENTITFHWWEKLPEAENVMKYTTFISDLCRMSREEKEPTKKDFIALFENIGLLQTGKENGGIENG